MKKKIVYILGLSHVGSTLVDLILGNQPNHVGLGEIYQIIKPGAVISEKDAYCSCGTSVSSCNFWGRVVGSLKEMQNQGFLEKYQMIVDALDEIFGEETILVDSSKLLLPLSDLLKCNKYEIKIVYIVRDVRAWTVSRLNTRKTFPKYFTRNGNYIKRLKQHYGWKVDAISWVLPLLTRTAGYFFWIWYLQNKSYKRFLTQNRLNYLQIGYEELGMNRELIIPKIQRFIGIDDHYEDFSTESSKSHVWVGNVKKADPRRRKNIVYDNRWLYRKEWLFSAAAYRNIMHYNNNLVYRNIIENSIW
jgi:hypothetical protein